MDLIATVVLGWEVLRNGISAFACLCLPNWMDEWNGMEWKSDMNDINQVRWMANGWIHLTPLVSLFLFSFCVFLFQLIKSRVS